jgi:hypothetical protein
MEVNQNPMGNKSDDKPEPGFERSSESRRQHGQIILRRLENTKNATFIQQRTFPTKF